MADEVFWIWLQQALGAGAPQAKELLGHFSSAQAAFEETDYPEALGLTRSQRGRLMRKDLKKAQRELARLAELGAFMLTPEDAEYRTLFEGMYAPPVVLYGRGTRFDPSDAVRVTVVGTRHADDNGVRVTRRVSAGLAAGGAVLISGGAEGLDSVAAEAALEEGGRVIVVQACGLDVNYPKAVSPLRERLLQSGGMLLTEFPLGSTARSFYFPIRNRLLAAASMGTLVTEAPEKSGALMTARWARDMGRDVFALPGTVGVACCAGSNELLKDGATLVTNASDILMAYFHRAASPVDIEAAIAAEERASDTRPAGSLRPEKQMLRVAEEPTPTKCVAPCPDGVPPAVRRVYDALCEREQTPTELSQATDLPLREVLSSLTMLELYGTVDCGAGQQYALRLV